MELACPQNFLSSVSPISQRLTPKAQKCHWCHLCGHNQSGCVYVLWYVLRKKGFQSTAGAHLALWAPRIASSSLPPSTWVHWWKWMVRNTKDGWILYALETILKVWWCFLWPEICPHRFLLLLLLGEAHSKVSGSALRDHSWQAWGPYWMPGIGLGLAGCKANALTHCAIALAPDLLVL